MKVLFNFIQFQVKHLVLQAGFLYAVLLFIVFGLFLIPNADSNYITYYIENYTGFPDAFWVASLGAIFINLLLAWIGFFFLEGQAKKIQDSGLGLLLRVSPISNLKYLFSKWLAYCAVLGLLALIALVCLFIINFDGFNPFTFLQPFLYFTVPFILFIAALIVIFDYGIPFRVIKIIVYINLVIFFAVPHSYSFLDFLGFNEFTAQINNQVIGTEGVTDVTDISSVPFDKETPYGIGFVPKRGDLEYFHFEAFTWMTYWVNKCLLMLLALLGILGFSVVFRRFKPRFKNLKKVSKLFPNGKRTSTGSTQKEGADNNTFQLKPMKFQAPVLQTSWVNLIRVNWLLFKNAFSKVQIITFILLWVAAFFAPDKLRQFLIIPGLFLIGFKLLERFIHVPNQTRMQVFFKTGMNHTLQYLMVACSFLFLFFLVCTIPQLILGHSFEFISISSSILKTALFTLILVSSISLMKRVKPMEILYMIVFGSYLAGFPVVSLF